MEDFGDYDSAKALNIAVCLSCLVHQLSDIQLNREYIKISHLMSILIDKLLVFGRILFCWSLLIFFWFIDLVTIFHPDTVTVSR